MIEDKAFEALINGGIILYPTDTIWGLGCDATNENACQKIHALKKRPAEKSFIVLMDSVQMLEKYIPDFPEVCYDLIDLTDKPLTIIYPGAKGLAPSVLAVDGSVGVRITKDPICLALIKALRKPIVSTSANITGSPFPKHYSEIVPEISANVDAIVHARISDRMDAPSQIIKIGLDSSIQILRK